MLFNSYENYFLYINFKKNNLVFDVECMCLFICFMYIILVYNIKYVMIDCFINLFLEKVINFLNYVRIFVYFDIIN